MKFAIILSGCGQHDGSETQETILTLLSLAQENISWEAFAPDIPQKQVINHRTRAREPQETRNVLTESARLVRGKIKPISEGKASAYDAIVLPGGMGAVTNLCNWADKGADFSFDPQVKTFLQEAIKTQKPIGCICIAPVMIPALVSGATLTLGNDPNLAKDLQNLGCTHVNCSSSSIIIDPQHKLVTTPANMLSASIDEVYTGIHKLIKALAELAGAP